jgi:hypothetical protein
LLGDFNAKVGREYIFKPTVQNESLHENNKDNEVRELCHVNKSNCQEYDVTTSQNEYTWTSPDGKTHNQIDHILIDSQ